MTARDWLRANGYEDVAALIDQVMAEIAATGSKQRRNWWDVLAGGTNGNPLVVNGHEFPVLRVAQIRQGKPVTKNAICRNKNEQPPDVVATHRWPRKKGRTAKSQTTRNLSGHAQAG
jgi:hypothetical protein